jgi:hypothetical protein
MSPFNITGLSIILGHIAELNIMPTELPTFSAHPLTRTLLRGEIERWREDLSEHLAVSSNAPLIHLSCWLLRALKELVSHDSDPMELLNCAKSIVRELTGNPNFISPMTHHFTTVVALILEELKTLDSTKKEAEQSLATLRESRLPRTGWNGAIREYIGPNPNSNVAAINSTPQSTASHHVLTASQGLQRLADIATAAGGTRDAGTDESRTEPEKNNTAPSTGPPPVLCQHLRNLIRGGYLNVFL